MKNIITKICSYLGYYDAKDIIAGLFQYSKSNVAYQSIGRAIKLRAICPDVACTVGLNSLNEARYNSLLKIKVTTITANAVGLSED